MSLRDKDRIEDLIDAQDDPKSRAACMVLLRLIEEISSDVRATAGEWHQGNPR